MYSSSRSRVRGLLLPGVALLAVAAAASGCTSGSKTSTTSSNATETESRLQAQYEQTVRNVLPSVVQISTDGSTGSGVVYDDEGDIVTNEHVVGDAKTVQVRDAAGNQVYTANVVGKFAPDDLAVIRVSKQDAGKLKPAEFANSSDAQIGEIVLAMGNPLGLTDSVTQGIISATGRTVGGGDSDGQALITAAIQTSAAINPGNSGGALVDLEDQVVGIPTLAARLPDQGGAAPGIGFAIPSDTVEKIADQLIDKGKVTNSDRASLGITAQTSANQQGESVGVAVVAVAKGGTAANAGLQPGDVIVGINGQHISSLQQLEGTLNSLNPGQKVTITYIRSGTQRTASGKLGSLGS
jgi:putative serine protease PepD